jgi:hypothetical protein
MADAPNEGVSQRVEAQMVALYDAGMQDINAAVGRAMAELADDPSRRSSQYRLTRAAQLARSIDERLAELDRGSAAVFEPATANAVGAALRTAEAQMREIGVDPAARGPQASFAEVTPEEIEAIARDTVARTTSEAGGSLRAAARQHGANALGVFRTLAESPANVGGSAEPAVNRAIARGLISGDPRVAERAIRELFRDPNAPQAESYRRLGNKVIEVGRAQMSVRQYAMTVVRTRTREATVAARHERLGLSGISLVQITGADSVNFCTAFLGLVCSLSGAQSIAGVDYPALADLPGGGPPFHPNCSKGTAAYVPELVSASRASLHARAMRVYVSRRNTGRLTEPVRR